MPYNLNLLYILKLSNKLDTENTLEGWFGKNTDSFPESGVEVIDQEDTSLN